MSSVDRELISHEEQVLPAVPSVFWLRSQADGRLLGTSSETQAIWPGASVPFAMGFADSNRPKSLSDAEYQTLERWLRRLSSGEVREYSHHFSIEGPDGPKRILEQGYRPEGGDKLLGAWTDLTDVVAQRSALERESTRLNFLAESIPHIVWSADAEGQIDYVNERGRRILGAELEDLVGSTWLHFIHPEDQRVVRESWAQAIRHASEYRQEQRMFDARTGGWHWYLVVGTPLIHDGRIQKWYGVSTDIDEVRRTEEAQRNLKRRLHHVSTMQAIGETASGVAHDLNNVLTSLLGGLKLVREAPDRESVDELLKNLNLGVSRASDLTQQLLRIAKPSGANRPSVGPGPVEEEVEVNAVVASTVGLLERTVGPKIEISTDLQAKRDRIEGRAVSLESAFLNLGLNARDAMPSGGQIEFGTRNTSENEIEIFVRDSGSGMSEDVVKSAFEPFFSTKGESGTGLGLFGVKTVVESLGGEVTIDSELGLGTTVTLKIPLARR